MTVQELNCQDCCDPTCDDTVTADSFESLVDKMLAHIREKHAHRVEGKSIEENRAEAQDWARYVSIR